MAQNIMEGASQSETKQSDKQSNVKATIQTFLQDSYVPVRERAQQKIRKIFRDFSFSSLTLHLFLLNCLSWFSVNLIFYFSKIEEWQCVQFAFFAKFQPSITYNYQFWRLLFSSIMFRGWIQFYFNNFALNMLGYVIEKQSRTKFVLIFYGGILAGHMLSCCLSSPSQLTVGTSCGTIALLPCEICRFIKLRQTNPIQARSRRNFLIFNILSNFILNVLAIFHLDAVDWISHIGCLIAGCFFLIFYELKPKSTESQERTARIKSMIIRYGSMILLFGFYLSMALIIWVHLPRLGIGKKQLQKMNFECYKNI